MDERKWLVYMHIAPNGKRYVGITKSQNPNYRWRNGERYSYNEYFSKAIQEFGWENIQHIVVKARLTLEEARDMEVRYIAEYDTANREHGYNISPGGGLVAEETRAKLSAAGMGRIPWNKGKKDCFSTEALSRMSMKSKGRKVSEETKQLLREKFKGREISEEQKKVLSKKAKGRKVSDETREKLRKAMIGKQPSGADNKRSVQVSQYDKHGNLIAIFGSIREAERKTGINFAAIQRCCSGKAYTAGGFVFRRDSTANTIAIAEKPKEKRPILQYNLQGEFVSEYPSILSCSKETGINSGAISAVCSGRSKTAKGYIFKKKG